MPLKSICLTLATATLVALTLPASAQNKSGSNIDPAADAAPAGGVRTMVLAQDLYRVGVAQTDALTVLAAARLAASVAPEEKSPAALELTPEALAALAANQKLPPPKARAMAEVPTVSLASPRTGMTDGNDGTAEAPVTADAMFAKARELAAGDDAILRLINNTLAEGKPRQIGGASSWPSSLPAGQTDVWEVPFYATSDAEIAVLGDGDTNLDIQITDENGNVICRDVSWSASLSCNFAPAQNGYFYVTVQNLGQVQNSYHLLTN